MKSSFSQPYLDTAHKHSYSHESEIRKSTVCTCFYCGFQFNPNTLENPDWWEEGKTKERTLACPMCGIDAVLGDASGFPITDPAFIKACTEDWFSGYSRISDGLKPEEVKWTQIEVE